MTKLQQRGASAFAVLPAAVAMLAVWHSPENIVRGMSIAVPATHRTMRAA